MRFLVFTYILLILSGVLVSGCMGPDLEYVPQTITIYDPEITDITTNSAIVSWNTDYNAWSSVQITAPDSVSNTLLDLDMKMRHEMQIERLQPASSYILLIASSNNFGASSYETGKTLMFSTNALAPTSSTSE